MTHRLLSPSYSDEPVSGSLSESTVSVLRRVRSSSDSLRYYSCDVPTLPLKCFSVVPPALWCALTTSGMVGALQFIMNMVSFRPSFQRFHLKNGRCAHTTLSVIVYLL